MRLAMAKFGYQEKYDKVQQEALSPAFILGSPEFNEEGEFSGWYTSHLIDLDRLPDFISRMEIEKLIRVPELEELEQRDKIPLNKVVNVAVPDNGLLKIEEVTIQLNCCTEELQKCLDDGWRILAICPQPDQRRPDYVLGRHS